MEQKYIDRFWNKINRTDKCWEWTAGCNNGYGFYAIKRNGKNEYFFAHRLSWGLHFGDIPKDKQVLHKCDNRKCTNPDHLFLGDIVANMRDKVSKGRQTKGSDVATSKLTEVQVIEIIKKRPTTTISMLATEYGVSNHTIIKICKRRSWKHINL